MACCMLCVMRLYDGALRGQRKSNCFKIWFPWNLTELTQQACISTILIYDRRTDWLVKQHLMGKFKTGWQLRRSRKFVSGIASELQQVVLTQNDYAELTVLMPRTNAKRTRSCLRIINFRMGVKSEVHSVFDLVVFWTTRKRQIRVRMQPEESAQTIISVSNTSFISTFKCWPIIQLQIISLELVRWMTYFSVSASWQHCNGVFHHAPHLEHGTREHVLRSSLGLLRDQGWSSEPAKYVHAPSPYLELSFR